jgi:GH24 family phage-related lysozyme (muramidase)
MLAAAWPRAAPSSRFGATILSDTLKPTKISREGVILIKSFEGFRPRAIQRADGRWTIGYGHTASARDGLTVSESDAELLLQYDLIPVVKAVDEVQTSLNQHQYDALASFAFSVGVDRFRTSDVLARLNAGAPSEAAEALASWADDSEIATPPRRRAAERALFIANPDAPVSLADLLAAPLPPPTATLVQATQDTTEAVAFEAVDVAPFPAVQDTAPMTREAAVATLLGETAEPVDAEAAELSPAPVPAPAPIPAPEPEADTATDDAPASEAPAEVEDARVEDAAPTSEPGDALPKLQLAATNSVAAFYSPYAMRAIGPLSGFTPAIAASDDETSEPAGESVIEIVAANDLNHPTLAEEAEPAPMDAQAQEPDAVPEDAAPATTVAAPAEPEPSQPQATPAFVELPNQPVQVPVFIPAAMTETDTPSLVLTEAPGLLQAAPPHRLVWPETNGFAHLDQAPLFDADAAQGESLQTQTEAEAAAPRRFDWSETLTFLVMGAIGMLSFGAAMAAFRQASQSNAGDTVLIGWVLALIALACVGVSGYNLYQRWGRADQP